MIVAFIIAAVLAVAASASTVVLFTRLRKEEKFSQHLADTHVPLREGSQVQLELADPARSLLTPLLEGPDHRWAGPVQQCLCGCDLFHALISFDESKQVSAYILDGICHNCGASVSLTYETHDIETE